MPARHKDRSVPVNTLRTKDKCAVCHKDAAGLDYFMVRKELWAEFGADAQYSCLGRSFGENWRGNRKGFLCLPCFEARLGRRVELDDLGEHLETPCNRWLVLSLCQIL
jgi:hypothetical protein